MKRTVILAALALAVAGCAGNSAVGADKAVCKIAIANQDNPGGDAVMQMDAAAGNASPALADLVTKAVAAVNGYDSAPIGTGIKNEYDTYNAVTDWCNANGYGS